MSTTYIAEDNDDMLLIALKHGFRNWKNLYNHPENEKLRKKRPDPFSLYKGDEVIIPDKVPQKFTCETDKKHTFILPTPKLLISLYLEDGEQEPYAKVKCEIWIDNEKNNKENLRTDDKGLLSTEVPAIYKEKNVREVELRVWRDKEKEDDPQAFETYTLQIGHLDPIDTIEGIQDRLDNLGFNCGDEDEHGTFGPHTKTSLTRFLLSKAADGIDMAWVDKIDTDYLKSVLIGDKKDENIKKLQKQLLKFHDGKK
jgi:hypothetical protein